jgi:hypothetical protein
VLGISYHTLQAYLRYPAGDPAWNELGESAAEGAPDAARRDAAAQAM